MHYLNFRDNYMDGEIWIYADILFRVLHICFLLYWLMEKNHSKVFMQSYTKAIMTC